MIILYCLLYVLGGLLSFSILYILLCLTDEDAYVLFILSVIVWPIVITIALAIWSVKTVTDTITSFIDRIVR